MSIYLLYFSEVDFADVLVRNLQKSQIIQSFMLNFLNKGVVSYIVLNLDTFCII